VELADYRENSCFLLVKVATDFEQAHFCLSSKV
jgi:hypothetical protein